MIPSGQHAGHTLKFLSLLWTVNRLARQRRPKSSILAFDNHHATSPTVELISVILLEDADVVTVGIIKEQAISVVKNAGSGQKQPDRRRTSIVIAPHPGDDTIISTNDVLAILR